jgi:hypothetical protein
LESKPDFQESMTMVVSMYAASVPCFAKSLRALDGILLKAQAHAEAKKIDPLVLLSSRLFPDMFALTRQVQIASDHAKGATARLAGIEVPKYEDGEQSFQDLRDRISRTLAFIESVDAALIEGSENRQIALKVGAHELSFQGMDYLLGFALPNFHFHVVTVYNILRHNGVEIGKRDYLGA